MHRLRLLAATALLGAGLSTGVVLGAAAPAQAAVCPASTVQDDTRAAKAVFSGTVTAATAAPRADGQRGAVYTQTVTVDRVYQGRVDSDSATVQTERVPKQCTVGPLAVGSAYVFFVQGDGEPWLAAGGGGTAASDERLVSQVVRLLGEGRGPVPPQQETAEFTIVDAAAPTQLARVAAPGAALVIIGLLGLLVAGRVARRA